MGILFKYSNLFFGQRITSNYLTDIIGGLETKTLDSTLGNNIYELLHLDKLLVWENDYCF